jgi:hypothetical protein
MDHKEKGWEHVNSSYFTHDWDQWQVHRNMVKNIKFHEQVIF